MAKKIFSHKSTALTEEYVAPVVADVEDTPVFLASHDGKEWFSYDDEKVTVTADQGDFEVTVYNKTSDADVLAELAAASQVLNRGLMDIQTTLTINIPLSTLLQGIVDGDADVLAHIASIGTKEEEFKASLGF